MSFLPSEKSDGNPGGKYGLAGCYERGYSGVMNTSQLARATFVLDRQTAAQLAYISGAMGVSRSELVRDWLREPVELMAKWVESAQLARDSDGRIAANNVDAIGQEIQQDLVDFIQRKAGELRSDD